MYRKSECTGGVESNKVLRLLRVVTWLPLAFLFCQCVGEEKVLEYKNMITFNIMSTTTTHTTEEKPIS